MMDWNEYVYLLRQMDKDLFDFQEFFDAFILGLVQGSFINPAQLDFRIEDLYIPLGYNQL